MRLLAYGIILAALVMGALSPTMSATAANRGLSATGLKASVHGTHVTATATIKSAQTRKATRAGICARSASQRDVDFPASRNVSITRHGTTFTKTRTLAPGRYTFTPCVQFGHIWKAFGWKHSFTVPKKAAVKSSNTATSKTAKTSTSTVSKTTTEKSTTSAKATTTSNTGAPATQTDAPKPTTAAKSTDTSSTTSSSSSMPVGDLPGWHQVLAQDFTATTPVGGFPGPYAGKWMSYDGFTDTSGVGFYDQSIISAHDSSLDLYLHTQDGRPLGAAPIPLVNGQWGGQKYGMFSVRMKSDSLHNFGAAFLLWPDSNDWNDGEIDFPEVPLDGTVSGFNHCPGNPQQNCMAANTDVNVTQWHVYTIKWTPSELSFLIDGKVVGSTTKNIPQAAMHWVGQVGTNGVKPASSVNGHLLIDWMAIYTYKP
jgi:hypothetical protein